MTKSSRRRMGVFIPEELINKILVRIPALDLLRFKTVCKCWQTLISSRDFALEHLKHSKPDQIILFSWLCPSIIPHKYFVKCHSVNIQDNILTSQDLQLPLGFDQYCVRSSYNGLLLLQHHSFGHPNYISICNPVTRRYKHLPRPSFDCYKWAIVHDAISGIYKVFGIRSTIRSKMIAFVFMLGLSTDWKYLYSHGRPFRETYHSSGGYEGLLHVKNELHWTAYVNIRDVTGIIGYRFSMFSLDVISEELVTMIDFPFHVVCSHRLSEARGCLCVTNIFKNYLETWILDDRAANSWNKCSVINFESPFVGNVLIPSHINHPAKKLDMFFIVPDHYHVSVFDTKNQEMRKIAMQRSFIGWLDHGYCFHINSLVSWE